MAERDARSAASETMRGEGGGRTLTSMPAFDVMRSNVTWKFHRIDRALDSRMSQF